MLYRLAKTADRVIGAETVDAHCDVPCGIYDPAVALIAAVSVVRMIDIMTETAEKPDSLERTNTIARCIAIKEAEAAKVKDEVRIIWGDYFKAPQIEAQPHIHTLVHEIMMTAGACKQGVDRAKAEELVEKVNQFAEAFWATKNVATERHVTPYAPAMAVVRPA